MWQSSAVVGGRQAPPSHRHTHHNLVELMKGKYKKESPELTRQELQEKVKQDVGKSLAAHALGERSAREWRWSD